MKIYLVRHGQTEANYEGKLQGRSNQSLNETGIRQIKKLKEQLKDKKLDICFTSPLARAWETAIILAGDRVYITEDKRIIERELGNFEGRIKEEYDSKKYWDYNLNTDEEGVERIQDVVARSKEFLDEIKEKYPGKNILIVSHGAVVRALHHLLIGTDLNKKKDLTSLEINNAFFKEYEI